MTDVFAKKKLSLALLKAKHEHRHAVLTNPNHIYFTSSNKHDFSNIYVDFSPSNWTNVVGLKPAGKGSAFFFRATRQESFAVFQRDFCTFNWEVIRELRTTHHSCVCIQNSIYALSGRHEKILKESCVL